MLTLVPLKTNRLKNAFRTLYPQEKIERTPKRAKAGIAKGPSTEVMRATQSFTQDAIDDEFEIGMDTVEKNAMCSRRASARIVLGSGQDNVAAQRVEKCLASRIIRWADL